MRNPFVNGRDFGDIVVSSMDGIKTGIGIHYLLRVPIPFYPAGENVILAKTVTDFTFKKVESERLLIE